LKLKIVQRLLNLLSTVDSDFDWLVPGRFKHDLTIKLK